MALIPSDDNWHHRLNSVVKAELPRPYLGMSQIGHNCYRYLQYYHYWAFKIPISNRIQRLFNFGHMMENNMIEDLLQVDVICNLGQKEFTGSAGHWKGHIDSEGYETTKLGYKFLVEFKTHNDKSFKDLQKKKVKDSKPGHWGQMNAYMGYGEYEKCLYVAYNKNDSEYYTEFVNFDIEFFKEQKRKEVEVIASDVLLPRIGNGTPAWFECKMCDAKLVCFGRKEPEVNCRTCYYVDILDGGKWVCGNPASSYGNLNEDAQKAGCSLYELAEIFRD